MEYAHVPNYPLSSLVYGAHNQGHRRLPYNYIVIKGQGHVAMVDVGYNHKAYGKVLAETFGVQGWHPPVTVLAECGIKPADVSRILLTHAHFDHMGNIGHSGARAIEMGLGDVARAAVPMADPGG
jgi:glyoxylase-like metal-dependent hydrolase (beta-lactamase superfamily II)